LHEPTVTGESLSADNIFGIVAGTWADSNSGGAIAGQLKRCGYDGLFVRG